MNMNKVAMKKKVEFDSTKRWYTHSIASQKCL